MMEFLFPTNSDEPTDIEERDEEQITAYMDAWRQDFITTMKREPTGEEENKAYHDRMKGAY